MGTVTSKEDKVVDGGTVSTLGLYANVTPDYDKKVVRKLITARKLAPFYKGKVNAVDETSTLNPPLSLGLDEQVTSKTTPPTSLLYTVECPICFLVKPFEKKDTKEKKPHPCKCSTILRISTTLNAVTSRSVLNALSKSSAPIPSYPPAARFVSNPTLGSISLPPR